MGEAAIGLAGGDLGLSAPGKVPLGKVALGKVALGLRMDDDDVEMNEGAGDSLSEVRISRVCRLDGIGW